MVQLPPSGSATAASTHTKKVNHGVPSGQDAGRGGGHMSPPIKHLPLWGPLLGWGGCSDVEACHLTLQTLWTTKQTPTLSLFLQCAKTKHLFIQVFHAAQSACAASKTNGLRLSAGGLERADSESRPLQSDHQDAGAEVHPLPRRGCVQIIFTRVTRVQHTQRWRPCFSFVLYFIFMNIMNMNLWIWWCLLCVIILYFWYIF